MLSTGQMIDRLAGTVGTKDLNDWETSFVSLSEKQLEVLEHFAS